MLFPSNPLIRKSLFIMGGLYFAHEHAHTHTLFLTTIHICMCIVCICMYVTHWYVCILCFSWNNLTIKKGCCATFFYAFSAGKSIFTSRDVFLNGGKTYSPSTHLFMYYNIHTYICSENAKQHIHIQHSFRAYFYSRISMIFFEITKNVFVLFVRIFRSGKSPLPS